MTRLIKKIFVGLLTGLDNGSNHKKFVLLSNQKFMTQPTLINLHPNEYNQEFHYYPFAVKLDRCVGSYNTLNDLSNKVCVPNKTEELNLRVFNMITGINESKTLTKHVSCECKCRFDRRRCMYVKKIMFGILLHVIIKMETYLASIMDDSVIICAEIIETYDEETNFNEKKPTCKTQKFYILLAFLLITIALLIAVSIYCYLIKYGAKQKHLLPFQFANNKLK